MNDANKHKFIKIDSVESKWGDLTEFYWCEQCGMLTVITDNESTTYFPKTKIVDENCIC